MAAAALSASERRNPRWNPRRWSRIHNSYWDLATALTHGAFVVTGLIARAVGEGEQPPEWADLSIDHFREKTGLSESAVLAAIQEATKVKDAEGRPIPAIAVEKIGRQCRYKPLVGNWTRIAKRAPRHVKRENKPPEVARESHSGAAPQPAVLACPLGQTCTITPADLLEAGFIAVNGLQTNTSSPLEVLPAPAAAPPEVPAPVPTPPEPLHPEIERLAAWLTSAFSHFGLPPDQVILDRIWDNLGRDPALVDPLMRATAHQHRKVYSYGFIADVLAPKVRRAKAACVAQPASACPSPGDRQEALTVARELLADPFLPDSERELTQAAYPELAAHPPSPAEVRPTVARRARAALVILAPDRPSSLAARLEAKELIRRVQREWPEVWEDVRAGGNRSG